jgi:hypothetical protein
VDTITGNRGGHYISAAICGEQLSAIPFSDVRSFPCIVKLEMFVNQKA